MSWRNVIVSIVVLPWWFLSSVGALSAPSSSSNERRLQSRARGSHPLLSLNLNLDSLAKAGAASRAQELLQRINALHQEGYYDVSPDVVSYNSVLNAWKEVADPDKAMQLLEKMLRDAAIQPNTISFNTVILAFAKNGQYRQAENLLRKMQREGPKPDIITFNSVLYAFARSEERGAAVKAETLLREIMDQGTTTSITNVNSRSALSIKADASSFNTVLYAHSVAGAPLRAQELLDHMEFMFAAGNDLVEPDVYSYSTVIQAWANFPNNNSEAPFHAKRILEKMETLSMTRQQLRPNVVTYTSVMTALARSGAAQEANDLLDKMITRYFEEGDETVKPDTVSFSCVIDGWARSQSPEAADKALALLEQMKTLSITHDDPWMSPNSQTYTSVLAALARSRLWDSCVKAEEVLQEIEDSPFPGVSLSVIHYNAVLDAYGKSPRADKAVYVQKLLETLKLRQEIQPNTITYNSIIAACANSFGDSNIRQKALKIAIDSFRTILQDHEPTTVSFSIFFKAIRKLLPKGHATRFSLLQKSFRDCCSRGLVSSSVLHQLRSACTDQEWQQLIPPSALSTTTIPPQENNFSLFMLTLPAAWTINAAI